MGKNNSYINFIIASNKNDSLNVDKQGDYLRFDIDSNPYFIWSKSNESEINNHNLIEIDTGKPILYSHKPNIIGFDLASISSNNDQSGLLFTDFTFIAIPLDNDPVSDDDYANFLSKFEINDNTSNNTLKVPSIKLYKDALSEQIERHEKQISGYNKLMLRVLKVYQHEVMKGISRKIDSEKLTNIARDNFSVIKDLIIQGGTTSLIHNTIIPSLEKWKTHTEDQFFKSVENGFTKYSRLREPLYKSCLILIKQYLCSESLLEDILINGQIKSSAEFSEKVNKNDLLKYQDEKYWETAYRYYYEDDNSNWEIIYNRLCHEMKNCGLSIRHTSFESFKARKSKYDNRINNK